MDYLVSNGNEILCHSLRIFEAVSHPEPTRHLEMAEYPSSRKNGVMGIIDKREGIDSLLKAVKCPSRFVQIVISSKIA